MLLFQDENGSILAKLAREGQKVIVAVVRIHALLEKSGQSASYEDAISASGLSEKCFSEIEINVLKYFKKRSGRIYLNKKDVDIDPWDQIDQTSSNKIEKHLNGLQKTNAILQEDSPKGILLRKLVQMGCSIHNVEKTYYSLTRSHNHERVKSAIETTISKKPTDPLAYLLQILRSGTNLQPQSNNNKTVAAFIKPAQIENSKTILIGWEAPQSNDNPWPEGIRRMIYRTRTGHIRYEKPLSTTTIPSIEEDPGITIRQ